MLGFDATGRLALGQLFKFPGTFYTLTAASGSLTITGGAQTVFVHVIAGNSVIRASKFVLQKLRTTAPILDQ